MSNNSDTIISRYKNKFLGDFFKLMFEMRNTAIMFVVRSKIFFKIIVRR